MHNLTVSKFLNIMAKYFYPKSMSASTCYIRRTHLDSVLIVFIILGNLILCWCLGVKVVDMFLAWQFYTSYTYLGGGGGY